MATTSLWRVKGYIGKLILYAVNPEKIVEKRTYKTGNNDTNPEQAVSDVLSYVVREDATNNMEYVHAINCGVNSAKRNMLRTKNRFGKSGGVVAYHGYQSFAEGEVTPDIAHSIGVALADELWGDDFQVIVATHIDKASHIHNHFVINTVSINDGHKFHRTKKDYYEMREVSDRLCKEYGLSVIEHPANKGMNYGEWQAGNNGGQTIRGAIREAIDMAVRASITPKQFLECMDELGFIIDQSGKHAKIKQVGNERFVRFKSLGPGYSIEDILERIYNNDRSIMPQFPEQENPSQVLEEEDESVSEMNYVSLFRSYNRALNIAAQRPMNNFRVYYLVRKDTSAMRLYTDSLDLVLDHNLKTGQDVIDYKAQAMGQIDEIRKKRNEMRNLLRRAQRAGNTVEADKAQFNIEAYSRELSKLRREVTTCDEVLKRSAQVRDNLKRIEQQKFRGKEEVANEHISGRGRSGRENEPKRS